MPTNTSYIPAPPSEYTIQYSDIKNPSVILGGRIALDTYEDWTNNIVSTNKAIINAIDIDWDGAQLSSGIINTTSDLLGRLDDTYTKSEINELSSRLIGYYNQLNELSNNLASRIIQLENRLNN